jgi:hypothetical protein
MQVRRVVADHCGVDVLVTGGLAQCPAGPGALAAYGLRF